MMKVQNRQKTKCQLLEQVSRNLGDWYEINEGEPGVYSSDDGKHTGRNDLLFVEKMMWMGERV